MESTSRRFYGCYLLCSLNSRYKGRTYIGFTVNPQRRIRQHNGEITCGAWFTKKRRPWEMVLCVHGFPSQVHALQFEWAWQHPKKSLAVREAAAKLKNLTGVGGKIKLVFSMLSLPEWSSMKLTVQFFSTKHVHHKTGCQDLPSQMKVSIAPLEDLPSYENSFEDEIEHQEADDDSELSDSSIIKLNGHKRTGEMIEAIDETSASRKKAGRRGKKGKTSVSGIAKKDMDRLDSSNPPDKVEEHPEVMDKPVAGRKRKTKKCTKADSTSLFPYKDDIVEHSPRPSKEFPGLPRPPLTELSPYLVSSSPCTLQASPLSPYFPPFLSPCRRPFVQSPVLQGSFSSSEKRHEALDLTPLKQKAEMSTHQLSPHFHLGRKPGSSLCPFIILSSTPNQVNNREVIDLTDSPVPTMSSRIC